MTILCMTVHLEDVPENATADHLIICALCALHGEWLVDWLTMEV